MAYRKKPPVEQVPHEEVSRELGSSSELIASGHYDKALQKLDELAARNPTPDRACQIASLSAQVELEQGKFGAASETFAAALVLAQRSPRVWFGAGLGLIRAQLRNVDVDRAFATAQEILTDSNRRWQDFEATAANIAQIITTNGSVSVDIRPLRPSVAAFRLGQQFWEEGEPEKACWFYREALRIEPQGACRARIALAGIALANEEYSDAYEQARQALVMGRFRAKTLSAWPVLVTASNRLGRAGIDPALIRGLAQASPEVRGRARLVIVHALRAHNDPAWIEFANVSQKEDPEKILHAEFLKMKIASSANPGSEVSLDSEHANEEFRSIANLGPQEWLAAAKSTLTSRLAEDVPPAVPALIEEGITRYGESARGTIIHGLALACQAANQPVLALELLRAIAATPSTGRPASISLRAQLEADQGNLPAAINLYAGLAGRQDIASRFRILATLQWTRLVVQTGDNSSLAAGRSQLLANVQAIENYELLLDLARQMTLAPEEIASLAPMTFERGQTLARRAFGRQENPTTALEILFKLARRQSDFGATSMMIKTWEELSSTKRDWLWCQGATYWQYLALIASAYRALNQTSAADALSEKYLNDAATPPNGVAELGIPHALSLLNRGGLNEAFDWFNWITWQAPTHVLTAYAYYWLALKASKARDSEKLEKMLGALSLALGNSLGLTWMKELDARGRLLAGVSSSELAANTNYTKDYLGQQSEALANDYDRL